MSVHLTDLPTPFLTVDHSQLRANIAADGRLPPAQRSACGHMPRRTRASRCAWQLEAGAAGICCAKLGENSCRRRHHRHPASYPVNPANANRVAALLNRGVRLSIIVDDLEVARGEWSTAMTKAGLKLDVLVKVDVGFHRCGIDPDSPAALDRRVGPRRSD